MPSFTHTEKTKTSDNGQSEFDGSLRQMHLEIASCGIQVRMSKSDCVRLIESRVKAERQFTRHPPCVSAIQEQEQDKYETLACGKLTNRPQLLLLQVVFSPFKLTKESVKVFSVPPTPCRWFHHMTSMRWVKSARKTPIQVFNEGSEILL